MSLPGGPFRRVLVALFVIQFFSWSAMFVLWINAVPLFAGRILHQATGGAQDLQPALVAVSLCFAGYAALGAAGTLVLPGIIARAGHGLTYGLALLIAAFGLALLALAQGPALLVPAFVAIGIGWSAIGSIPYAILGKLAPEGRGAFHTRLFAFSTVLPQAVTSLAIALFARQLFGPNLQRVLILGAGAMALAGVIALACRPLFAPADRIADDW